MPFTPLGLSKMARRKGEGALWTELYLKAHKAKYHQSLREVHPDLNPSPDAHERTIAVTQKRGRIPVIPLRIEVGFRVKFEGVWWKVLKMTGGQLWLSRSNRLREVKRIKIQQKKVEDVRCGPHFKFVMVEIF